MQYFNDFIVWLAACPHFVVFTGLCSVASIFTLASIAYFLHPVIKPDYPPDVGQKVTLKLIERLGKTSGRYQKVFSLTSKPAEYFPKVRIEKIDLSNSFTIAISREVRFYLIKYRRHLYLFANCCQIEINNTKCIASDVKTKELKDLLELLLKEYKLEPEVFINDLFSMIN